MVAEKRVSGLAITSFVLGIVSILFSFLPFLGSIVSVVAVVFGFVALSRMKRVNLLVGRWLSIVGIVLGFASLVLSIISLVTVVSVFSGLNLSSSEVFDNALEIGSLDASCSDVIRNPASCNALNGTVFVEITGRGFSGEISADLVLTDGSEVSSRSGISDFVQGDLVELAPSSDFSGDIDHAEVNYLLCGDSDYCVACSLYLKNVPCV